MYKNQLQELAQRSCFNLPSYACIREGPDHAPRFKATVNFNGDIFESPTFCTTLRQAEHSAAEVALHLLSNKGPSKALAARVLDETGVYKNLLQETAHRAGMKLPEYTTIRSGPGHVPVFSCTVELAGMSFTGEPAKTKKQAQKNAAIAAWSTLKQRSSTSLSSSPLPGSGCSDEQEQVIVARYLASLQSPESNKSNQESDQLRSATVKRDVIPYDSGRMQYQSWVYPHLSPEVSLYQNWPQGRASQQQSRLLALQTAPAFPSSPQIFPFIRSVFQPDHGQYLVARGQESVPFVPGMGPFLYFSSGSIPLPIRSISQVTIKEIEENPQLHSDANSNSWTINVPSNASGLSPIQVTNPPITRNSHSDPRIPEMLQEQDDEKNHRSSPNTQNQNSNRLESERTEHLSWNSPRSMSSKFRPQATSAEDAKFRVQTPQSLDYLHYNSRPRMPSSTGSAGGSRPSSFAAPVTVRTANAALPGSLRPENSHPLVPAPRSTIVAVSGCSTRPWLGNKNAVCLPSASFMAPAVHIRSVVPVCSAPPAKSMPSSSKEPIFSVVENRTKKPGGDISAANSDLKQQQI